MVNWEKSNYCTLNIQHFQMCHISEQHNRISKTPDDKNENVKDIHVYINFYLYALYRLRSVVRVMKSHLV